jgi:hypothetical protein
LITVKKAQQAKAKKSTDDTIDIDTVSPVDQSEIMEQIDKLKTERFNRKMFKVHKELFKTVKIARNREIQRLVKKLKTVRHLLSNMEDKMRTEFGISQFTQDVFDGVPDALLKSYRKQRGRAQQSENQLEQLKQVLCDISI